MTVKLDELLVRHSKNYKEMKIAAHAKLHEVFTAAFMGIPDLKLIRVQGFTPGFMDGDPCVHSMQAAVDIFDPEDVFHEYLQDSSPEEQRLKREEDENLALLSSTEPFRLTYDTANNKYVTPEDPFYAALDKVHELMHALSDDFALLYRTNWQLDIVRQEVAAEDLYVIVQTDYNCGY